MCPLGRQFYVTSYDELTFIDLWSYLAGTLYNQRLFNVIQRDLNIDLTLFVKWVVGPNKVIL